MTAKIIHGSFDALIGFMSETNNKAKLIKRRQKVVNSGSGMTALDSNA